MVGGDDSEEAMWGAHDYRNVFSFTLTSAVNLKFICKRVQMKADFIFSRFLVEPGNLYFTVENVVVRGEWL